MGLTAYSMTQHGVHVDAVETSKDVIEEARVNFTDVNHNILSSPSFDLIVDDERNYLLMTGEKYDIISVRSLAPSPGGWNSHIYTTDFYRRCKSALDERGILCQWLPIWLFSEAHFKMALRTFLEVFPHTTLWYKYTPDFVILIGTSEPLKIDYKNFIDRAQIANISGALAHDDLDGKSLLDSFMMGEDALRSYTGDGSIYTDSRPYLGFIRAKQSVGSSRSIIAGMAKYRERVNPYLKNYGRTMAEKTEVRKQVNLYFDATQRLIEGQIVYVAEEYEEAFGYFNRGLAINPRDRVIRYHLEVAAGLVRKEEQKELKQLEQVVKETLQTNPQETEGYIQLAVIYEGQGRLEESAKAIEKAIELEPNRLDFYLLLGPIYERQKRSDEALRTYQRLEKLDSNLPAEIFAAMASIFHLKNMLPEAQKYAEKTLEVNPNSWRGHYVLGNIYAEENAVSKAIDSYQRAIQLSSNEPLLHSDLADLYLTQRRYDDALKANTEALRLAPSAPELQEQRRQIQAAMQRKS
jgi:spermidine synthase